MTESKEFVKVLSDQYPLKRTDLIEEKAIAFWLNVEKLAMEKESDERELLEENVISNELWSNYNGLPQFENDLEAAKYFAGLVKEAMKKEPTAIELFKIERRIGALENAFRAFRRRGIRIG